MTQAQENSAPPAGGDRFGELAVALGLTTAEKITAALIRQMELKAQGIEKRIGEILAEDRVLDLRSVQKVLLEQQRRRKAATGPAALPAEKRFGEYELLAKVGEGGMGAVYRARDAHMGRLVALKVMNKSVAGNSEFVERFKREAKATGALNHPNIVSAYAAGEVDGTPFIAMEFVDGESLRKRFKTLGRMVEPEALRIARGVASGLAHAHASGFVHRDVKPDNVLLGANGEIKIVDLGLAKAMADDQRLTKTGIALGTPHYISPEQARGEKQVDHRSDIYSLGSTLYLLLTGRVPFDGKTNAEIMLKQCKEELDNPQDIVPELSDGAVAIVTKMMAKRPSDRYDSCEQLVADLELVQRGQPPRYAGSDADVEKSSIRPAKRKVRRARPQAKGGCMVVLLLVLALGGLALCVWRHARPGRSAAGNSNAGLPNSPSRIE
ncbi:MAG: serine/threonine protein kinase [Planctomycetes bacterium]|nr:serine/threonine protein kinase [Planctomycetota bacterium]